MTTDTTEALLQATLSCAVPIWIEQLKRAPWGHVQERTRVCGDAIATTGDVILYKSKRKGKTAEAFNRLAEGVACLAFAPGGVTIFGLHFEAHHGT